VYQYYKLSQLETYWLDLLETGYISVKAAAHLGKLNRVQRDLLRGWPGFTPRAIFALDPAYDAEQTKQALEREAAPTRELRVQVPAERYEEMLQRVREWLDDGGEAGVY
jgi:hypothetical protein